MLVLKLNKLECEPQPIIYLAMSSLVSYINFSFFFCLLGWHLRHMELPRLGVELELQLPTYATATTTLDQTHVCDLHHSSWQCWTLNPLSEAGDQTCNLMAPSQIHFHCAMMGTPTFTFKLNLSSSSNKYSYEHFKHKKTKLNII